MGVAGLDEDPASLAGLGEPEATRELLAVQHEREVPRLVALDSQVPSSQMITAPLPRGWPSWTPSNSPAEREWSSTGTARRRTAGSAMAPWGRPMTAAQRHLYAQIKMQAGGVMQLD